MLHEAVRELTEIAVCLGAGAAFKAFGLFDAADAQVRLPAPTCAPGRARHYRYWDLVTHARAGLQVALLVATYTTLPSLALQALPGYALSEAACVAAAAAAANVAVAGAAWCACCQLLGAASVPSAPPTHVLRAAGRRRLVFRGRRAPERALLTSAHPSIESPSIAQACAAEAPQ
jgi:hypothetical protein